MGGDYAGEVLRTPDERLRGLPGYAFAPCYVTVGGVRMRVVADFIRRTT